MRKACMILKRSLYVFMTFMGGAKMTTLQQLTMKIIPFQLLKNSLMTNFFRPF